MNQDNLIIAKFIKNEEIRKEKQRTRELRIFGVDSIQDGPNRLGWRSSPIYVKLVNAKKDLIGSLLSGGNSLFYVDDVSEEGGFSKLFLFANENNDHVKRENFPQKLTEIC